MSNLSEDTIVRSLVCFSATDAMRLPTTLRLPGSYIGVRRVRPSSHEVQAALRGKECLDGALSIEEKKNITFTVTDPETGVERRMNKKEKRALRRHLAQERKRRAHLIKKERIKEEEEGERGVETKVEPGPRGDDEDVVYDVVESIVNPEEPSHDSRYVKLSVDPRALADELADLRGERQGVPPVAIPPAMGSLLLHQSTRQAVLDNNLGTMWAKELAESFEPAMRLRHAEDMRVLAYYLVPEAWKRLKPAAASASTKSDFESIATIDMSSSLQFTLRPVMTPYDADARTVLYYLHTQFTSLHVSCGAKFGCDFLLYDGPRQDRHAFAGLRILSGGALPRLYDLTGYVRCLNTAGKLALVAKVQREEEEVDRIAIVDLALEHFPTDEPARRKRKRKGAEERLETLAKTKS